MRKPRTSTKGPFGEVVRASGPTAGVNPFGFSTKYTDQETGMDYYGYRYYNPSTGRWISRDPIGDDAFFNQPIQNLDQDGVSDLSSEVNDPSYLFVKNGPLNNVDWLGLNTVIHVTMYQVDASHDNNDVVGQSTHCCDISFQQQVSVDGAPFRLDGPGEQRYGNKMPPYQWVRPHFATTSDNPGWNGWFSTTPRFFGWQTHRIDFISILYCDDSGLPLATVHYGFSFTKGKYANYGTGTFTFW